MPNEPAQRPAEPAGTAAASSELPARLPKLTMLQHGGTAPVCEGDACVVEPVTPGQPAPKEEA